MISGIVIVHEPPSENTELPSIIGSEFLQRQFSETLEHYLPHFPTRARLRDFCTRSPFENVCPLLTSRSTESFMS
jgi:hypothetical protein